MQHTRAYALDATNWEQGFILKLRKTLQTLDIFEIAPIIAMDTFCYKVYPLDYRCYVMKTLREPRFTYLPHGECAGAPVLHALWDRFDLSLLLSQSGIYKDRGVPLQVQMSLTGLYYDWGFLLSSA